MSNGKDATVILVTGALTGIGRATAIAFAKGGATVVAAGRREAEGKALETELRSLGAQAAFIKTDLRREDEVRHLVKSRAFRPAQCSGQQCRHRGQAWSTRRAGG